jgi:hypothetical protein
MSISNIRASMTTSRRSVKEMLQCVQGQLLEEFNIVDNDSMPCALLKRRRNECSMPRKEEDKLRRSYVVFLDCARPLQYFTV